MLYKGYVGSNYTSWGLECDDDLYFATKTAIHCFADNSTPVTKYEIPHRVGYGDNATLEDVQRRGAKVLEVAQTIYEYGMNGTDNYIKAVVSINKSGNLTEQNINGTEYVIQNYSVTANKELESYNVIISDFPTGTKILNSSNVETSTMNNSIMKIAIPKNSISNDITGHINIREAKVKSYPIFYGDSGNNSTQNYIFMDPSEVSSAYTKLTLDSHKSSIRIVKEDSETKTKLANVKFNFKYEDGEIIGDYLTDQNGVIELNNLRPSTIIATEISTNENYILDSTPKKIEIAYAESKSMTIGNEIKKGNLIVYKVDEYNNRITLGNVTFDLYSEEFDKVIGTYTTDSNGEIKVNNLRIGNYRLIEKNTVQGYLLNTEVFKFKIDYNATTTQTIINEEPTGSIKIIKRDSETGNIPQGDGTLENAVYKVYANEDIYNASGKNKLYSKGDLVATRTTNIYGNTEDITDVPLGKYIVKEEISSKGYLLDTTEHEVNLEYKNQTTKVVSTTITSNEVIKKMQVHIFKSGIKENSGLTQGLQGAEFTIKLYKDVEKAYEQGYSYEEIWGGIDEYGNKVKVDTNRVAKAQVIAPSYETIVTDEQRKCIYKQTITLRKIYM